MRGGRAIIFHLVVHTSSLVTAVGCNGPRQRGDLMKKLWNNADYDKYTRPNEAILLAQGNSSTLAQPDSVNVSLRFDSLQGVDVAKGTFDAVVTFEADWYDHRLRFNGTASGGCLGDFMEIPGSLPVWEADLRYVNLVKSGMTKGEYTRVYSDGKVVHYKRSYVTLACRMVLTKMPYDQQRCRTRLSTFAGNERTVILNLMQAQQSVTAGITDAGQQYNTLVGAAEFRIKEVYGEVFDHRSIGDDDYSLDFVTVIERDSAYYTQYVIVPTILVVVMSYVSFFVTRQAPGARGAAAATCFLTLSNMITGVRNSLPKTSGEEGILLLQFLQVSSFFCFYTVMEFGLGSYLMRANARADKYRKQVQAEAENHVDNAGTEEQQDIKDVFMKIMKDKARARHAVGRLSSLNLRNDGRVWLNARHVDIFSRSTYMPAYIIALLILFLR